MGKEVVMFDDVINPNAAFLFEVNGLGGPMMPYRYYAAREGDLDKIAEFYLDRLPEFEVELDEVEEGHRHLMLTSTGSVLNQLGAVEDPMALPEKGRELDGSLVGVEVIHSSDDISISRLRIARHAFDHGEDIPEDSIIIVLEYFKNPY